MKYVSLLAAAVALSACSSIQNAEVHRAGTVKLPFGPKIDCNPQPELVYSKAGDLIETIYPILHPYCDAANRPAETIWDRVVAFVTTGDRGSASTNGDPAPTRPRDNDDGDGPTAPQIATSQLTTPTDTGPSDPIVTPEVTDPAPNPNPDPDPDPDPAPQPTPSGSKPGR